MYKTITILLLATYAMASFTPANGCGENCSQCVDGACKACWKSVLSGGICDEGKDMPANCLMTQIDDEGVVSCAFCNEGFAMEPFTQTCVPGKIDNCFLQANVFGQYVCLVCKNSTPADGNLACGDPLLENCEYGANGDDGKSCFKCKEGYVSRNGVCAVTDIQGCMISTAAGTCQGCNAIDGWFAQVDNKSCQKQE